MVVPIIASFRAESGPPHRKHAVLSLGYFSLHGGQTFMRSVPAILLKTRRGRKRRAEMGIFTGGFGSERPCATRARRRLVGVRTAASAQGRSSRLAGRRRPVPAHLHHR